MSFGALRVINEDRVEPSTGFGTHGHREFEIFSYVVAGELQQCVMFVCDLWPSADTVLQLAKTPWATPKS